MIVDAHNHLVFPNEGPDAEPFILDPKPLIDSGVIGRVWVLSTGDCVKHKLADHDAEVLSLARAYPDFCVPFAYLDFEKPPETVDQFHDMGFAGLKAIFPPKAYDDESFFPYYEKAEKHRMPIVFHTGGAGYDPPGTGLFPVPARRQASKHMFVQTLDLVAKVFPKLNMVCAHMGGKHSYDFALFLASRHPNVYLDISCSFIERDRPDLMCEVIDVVGADKILFGSDSRGDAPIRKALFWKYFFETRRWATPEVKDKILGLNAERILAESGYSPRR